MELQNLAAVKVIKNYFKNFYKNDELDYMRIYVPTTITPYRGKEVSCYILLKDIIDALKIIIDDCLLRDLFRKDRVYINELSIGIVIGRYDNNQYFPVSLFQEVIRLLQSRGYVKSINRDTKYLLNIFYRQQINLLIHRKRWN